MAGYIPSDFGGAFVAFRVLATGHTGFKGGWLSTLLTRLGAGAVGGAQQSEPGLSFFEASGLDEAGIQRPGCTKAQARLGWRPQLDLPEAVRLTAAWYRSHAAAADVRAVTRSQIEDYSRLMAARVPNAGAPVASPIDDMHDRFVAVVTEFRKGMAS